MGLLLAFLVGRIPEHSPVKYLMLHPLRCWALVQIWKRHFHLGKVSSLLLLQCGSQCFLLLPYFPN